MTKEEYNAEWDSLVEQEKAIYQRRIKLNIAFVQEHKKFNVGDKVMLTQEPRNWFNKDIPEKRTEAYVSGIGVFKGRINYKFLKAKADGSPSKNLLHLQSYDRIELIEPSKP